MTEPKPTTGSKDGKQPIILFRSVCPTDLAHIYKLERESYPVDEAASRAQIQYRQHHAANFFRCAVLIDEVPVANGGSAVSESIKGSQSITGTTNNMNVKEETKQITTNAEDNRYSLNGIGKIIGFITGTRCHNFDEESMKTHDPSGKLLAIHSVVVAKEYRCKGIGGQMMDNYMHALDQVRSKLRHPMNKVVLITKMHNVGFYLRAGFSVLGKSKICHGKDTWYDCQFELKEQYVEAHGGSIKVKKAEKKYECWIMDSFAKNFSNMSPGGAGMVGIGGGAIVSSGKGTGNPAAVVMITDGGQIVGEDEEFDPIFEDNQQWMKIVAREFNLSETAFIWEHKPEHQSPKSGTKDGANEYHIRYYTCDGTEIDLCGHATLAASSVVFQKLTSQGVRDLSVVFHAKFDILKARPVGSIGGSTYPSKVVMEFPPKQTFLFEKNTDDEAEAKKMIKESLFPDRSNDDIDEMICDIGLDSGGDDLLVELTTDAFLSMPSSCADISFGPMQKYGGYKRGVIVCCVVPEEMKRHGEKADFFSRFFGPKVGIDEDPVTGSAHCVLGPYFGEKLEKDFVVGSQKSQRGGIVECTMMDDEVVRLAGHVKKAMSGTLYL